MKKRFFVLIALALTFALGCFTFVGCSLLQGGNNGGTGGTVAVTGVSITPATLSLNVDGEYTLIAAVSPSNATNKSVSWSSSNPAVADVDTNGKVTAIAAGSAEITVTTADGNKTAKCAVTVNAAQPETPTVTGIVATASKTMATVGD
ncbi:MAG: Ig domain-containing protein, partial [Candidatus Coproplasma sp.]